MEIKALARDILCDVNKANQPFEVIGRVAPVFNGQSWGYTEQLFQQTYMKAYPNEEVDCSEYINSLDKLMLLAYDQQTCVGQIRARANWNRYCLIEDIAVAAAWRGKGVGGTLMRAAIRWAADRGLRGMMLETQDINLNACRFYSHCGFTLGAADTMLYANFDNYDEIALFWYMKF